MFGIDINEIAANSIVGIVIAVFSWIGARVGVYAAKINRASKDLDAIWPRLRAIETILEAHHDSINWQDDSKEAPGQAGNPPENP